MSLPPTNFNENTSSSSMRHRRRGRPAIPRPCPHCLVLQESFRSASNHARYCAANPSNIQTSQQHHAAMLNDNEPTESDAFSAYSDDVVMVDAGEITAAISATSDNNVYSNTTVATAIIASDDAALGDEESSLGDDTENFGSFLEGDGLDEYDLSNIQYKTTGVIEESENLACVYDCRAVQDVNAHTYSTSQLISMELYDLVNKFTIPREGYRELVRLMNTMIRDADKLARETDAKILNGPQVERIMKNQTTLAAHSYDVCVNGCKMYNLNDNRTICNYCRSKRYEPNNENSNLPLSTMKVLSIGDVISRLLANPITREELKYRHNYDQRENAQPGVIADFFDGEEYKTFKNSGNFQSEHDVAIALFNDGFVTDNRGSRLFTMIHMVILSYHPQLRYKDEYVVQLCILPGKKKPASFASYLSVILAEIHYLSTYGMVVRTSDAQDICSKVHCLVAGGDTLGIFEFSRAAYHSSILGCRICYTRGVHPNNRSHGMYFPDSEAPLRSHDDYLEANPELGFHGPSLFTQLSTFSGPQMFVFDEMHTLARGVSSELLQLLTVDLSFTNNRFYYTHQDGNLEVEQYPFFIPRARLHRIGQAIEDSRATIPVCFDGSFQNIIGDTRGTRAVDYLDFALYIIPTLLVPELGNPQAQNALIKLVRGMCLALQWEFTASTLEEIDTCVATFQNYCRQKANQRVLSISVFRPVMHYLSHITWIIKRQGPLVVYSTRSQERSIGKFSDLITGKVKTNVQASNLIETVAVRNLLKRTFDTHAFLQGIRPQPYGESSFWTLHSTSNQLWEPFEYPHLLHAAPTDTFEGVTVRKIKKSLTNYYRRLFSTLNLHRSVDLDISVAHSAWINTIKIPSELHRRKTREYRRGNQYVLFYSSYRQHTNSTPIRCWFVGSVLFFFKHRYDGVDRFLALIEVMKRHTVAAHDSSIPVVFKNRPIHQQQVLDNEGNRTIIDPKYCVINIDDIELQVGLVKSIDNDLMFSVIGNYHVFSQNMALNAGDIRNL